jgi:hypothetical protein
MIRPRFNLRFLLIAIAILSVPMGWAASQLNWIRQRHEFLHRPDIHFCYGPVTQMPWGLSAFFQDPVCVLTVPKEWSNEAQALYPEAAIVQVEFPMSKQ